MDNSKRAKVPSLLKGKLGRVQTQTHTLSEQDSLKKRKRVKGDKQVTILEL